MITYHANIKKGSTNTSASTKTAGERVMPAINQTFSQTSSVNAVAAYASLKKAIDVADLSTNHSTFIKYMVKVEDKFLRIVRGAYIGKYHGDIDEAKLTEFEKDAKSYFEYNDKAYYELERLLDDGCTVKDAAYIMAESYLIPEYS